MRTDAENLKDAIEAESYEVDTMYREFAKEAAASGDNVAADRFEEIRHDEAKHRDAFKTALTTTGFHNHRGTLERASEPVLFPVLVHIHKLAKGGKR